MLGTVVNIFKIADLRNKLLFTVALLLTISGFVLDGLSTYYHQTTSVVCLPLP
jgi:hypothetical protein